jgi:hypothetical protein
MARWVLNCPQCEAEFTHSKIGDQRLVDYYLPAKPGFPKEGLAMECPNCHKSSVFYRHQLAYRPI